MAEKKWRQKIKCRCNVVLVHKQKMFSLKREREKKEERRKRRNGKIKKTRGGQQLHQQVWCLAKCDCHMGLPPPSGLLSSEGDLAAAAVASSTAASYVSPRWKCFITLFAPLPQSVRLCRVCVCRQSAPFWYHYSNGDAKSFSLSLPFSLSFYLCLCEFTKKCLSEGGTERIASLFQQSDHVCACVPLRPLLTLSFFSHKNSDIYSEVYSLFQSFE